MINEISHLSLVFLSGVFLGLFFFGGLWWTIQKAMSSKNPALWFISSGLLRTVLVLTGFYYIGSESLQKMITCFLGFLLARMIYSRYRNQSKEQYES